MTEPLTDYLLPPTCLTAENRPRRVGFELEFSGIDLDQASAVLLEVLGGKLTASSAAERQIEVDGLGQFNVELDWAFLKRKAAEAQGQDDAPQWLEPLSQAAALVVPVEVVCPPVAVTDLQILDPMVEGLRDAGAVGTDESLLAAYGVHINTEVPSRDAGVLAAYLKSFALLQWWLVERHEVDTARRLSPYIDLYPAAYLERVVAQKDPTIDEIFDDYLAHNATRNRALDLLPLLADIDSQRVSRSIEDDRIKARPTFHYRLPNCHIEQADWTLAGPWNTWCVLEQLVELPEARDDLGERFLASVRPVLGVDRGNWVEFIGQWLADRGLA